MELFQVYFFLLALMASVSLAEYDPDQDLDTLGLARSKGYPAEKHEVITEDGYIITIHRVPHGRGQTSNGSRPVVYLQHGLLSSSASWVVNFPDQSPGFLLADAGYDVWLGNVRGNNYAIKHQTLATDSDEFWDFSWDQMAQYDIPASVDYVLNHTGQTRLNYIGHSQGTLVMFAKLSQDQKFAKKIKVFVALAPVAYLANLDSAPASILTDFGKFTNQEFWYSIAGRRGILSSLKPFGLQTKTPFSSSVVLAVQSGSKNQSRTAVYLAHTPAGTSVKNVVHFSQLIATGEFQSFDYGSIRLNLKNYGQLKAPVYDPTQIKAPVALYSGENDIEATPKDVEILAAKLPNIVDQQQVEDWDHEDFVTGLNFKEKLLPRILSLLSRDSY